MKYVFRITIIMMMVIITFGAALESKLTTKVALAIMALTIALAGIKAFFAQELFDWITPGWAEYDEETLKENKGKVVIINRVLAVSLLLVSIFEFYMVIFA
jgi:hypothetical protein